MRESVPSSPPLRLRESSDTLRFSVPFSGEQAFPGGEGKGFFVQPTVFSNVSPTSTIGTEEVCLPDPLRLRGETDALLRYPLLINRQIFGPVATILKFSSEDEAVEIANATSYGLAAAIHTTDLNQAPRVVRRLKAGTTWINTYSPLTPQAPVRPPRSSSPFL